mgnify:CR=1 FL=1
MALGDIFKVNQYKQEIKNLHDQLDKKLSVEQMKPFELDQLISDKENQIKNIQNEIEEFSKEASDYDTQIKTLTTTLSNLKQQIIDVEDQIKMESYGLYKPRYTFSNSLSYKEKLGEVRQDQKSMIRNDSATYIFRPMTLDGSKSKGRSMQKKNGKQLLRSFNGESEAAINKVTYSNFDRIQARISKSFEQLNKLNEPNGIRLTSAYLDSKIDELHLAFEYEEKKQSEKEELREQRQREREEKALKKEIADQQKNIDKEIKHYSNVISDLEAELKDKNEAEKSELLKQIDELQNKVNDYEGKKSELDYRLQNSTAGYVYIISNIGSFGENVVKIGVTRRLEPMDRIDELGSASVPFKFDVHALIFSYDAYKLETELHEKFADKRINKVNNRKEYFNLTITEVEQALKEYKDLTIDFHEEPEAGEYRESLKISELNNA